MAQNLDADGAASSQKGLLDGTDSAGGIPFNTRQFHDLLTELCSELFGRAAALFLGEETAADPADICSFLEAECAQEPLFGLPCQGIGCLCLRQAVNGFEHLFRGHRRHLGASTLRHLQNNFNLA